MSTTTSLSSLLAMLSPTLLLTILPLIYVLAVVTYRLYLSPLAKFPGPKLAAATFGVEFYWDVILRGRYEWVIRDMHRKYGPIVRITPDELHIDDPDFFDEVYPGTAKQVEKSKAIAGVFGKSLSIIATVNHDLHRKRRAQLNPFFSKQTLMKYIGSVEAFLEKLSDRLEASRISQEPLNLRNTFSALTLDVISLYSFGEEYNCLEMPDFGESLHKGIASAGELALLLKQYPQFFELANMMPYWLVRRLDPNTMSLIEWRDDLANQVRKVVERYSKGESPKHASPTIFNTLLTQDVPPLEKSMDRLVGEGIALIGAGSVTSAQTMATCAFHLLSNPAILQHLRHELDTAFPDPAARIELIKCEQLPYLTAILKETLRIAGGITHRAPRVAPDRDLNFRGWIIPRGNVVSMSWHATHMDANVFPAPLEFQPERWLPKDYSEEKAGKTTSSPLDKYLQPFGHGTRNCLGLNLAWAELYLGIAMVFRRFELELYGTTRADVDIAHDWIAGAPRLESKGVRVVITGRRG